MVIDSNVVLSTQVLVVSVCSRCLCGGCRCARGGSKVVINAYGVLGTYVMILGGSEANLDIYWVVGDSSCRCVGSE